MHASPQNYEIFIVISNHVLGGEWFHYALEIYQALQI